MDVLKKALEQQGGVVPAKIAEQPKLQVDTVEHAKYGKGLIINITEDKIYVDFDGSTRIFPYPAAFDNGYIKLLNKG